MTVVNPKSISGITSITTASGSDNLLTIHTNDGTERVRVDSTGTTKIVTGIVTTLTATTGIVTSLEATTGDITTLRAPTGIVTSLEATTGNITTLRAPTGIVTTFVTNTAKVGAAVTISESGIEASGIGITCANLNRSQIGGRRNIVINGAMVVAQRGTSSTQSGYYTVDRFQNLHQNTDEAPTQERASVSPSTEIPYRLGFTKSYKITNGNQTGGAAANSTCLVDYRIEAQDLRHCSWNFKDSTENIVLSYWVKASVAQTYYVRIYTGDTPSQAYTFGYALSANTWTKIVHKIPGYGNIVFNDDNGIGMIIRWYQYRGTDYTDNSVTLNEWRAHNSSQNTPDQTTTWYTTNDATWEITGVQLEAGDQATNFEHRSFGEELQLCSRYFQQFEGGSNNFFASGFTAGNDFYGGSTLPMGKMRTAPTIAVDGTLSHLNYTHVAVSANASSITNQGGGDASFVLRLQSTTNTTSNAGSYARLVNSSTNLTFAAEL